MMVVRGRVGSEFLFIYLRNSFTPPTTLDGPISTLFLKAKGYVYIWEKPESKMPE